MHEPCTSLGSYQDEAIQFMKERPSGAVFLPMGLGKTFVTIEWLKYAARTGLDPFPVVVFAPKIVCHSWLQEIESFGNGLTAIDLSHGSKSKRLNALDDALMDQVDIVLTNYEFAGKLINYEVEWRTLICDESTHIKNVKAQRSKAIYAIAEDCRYRWILTGMPITRDLTDLYGQFYCLDQGHLLGKNYWHFLNKYCVPIDFGSGQRGWTPRAGAMERIKATLRDHMFKRRREDCITLPGKQYVEIEVDPTIEMKRLNREVLDYWRVDGKELYNALSIDMALRQIALGFLTGADGQVKLHPTNRYQAIAELVDSCDGTVVIWTNFIKEQSLIVDALGPARQFDVINGSTPNDERTRVLTDFYDGHVDTLIISEQVGSFGLNELRDADVSIYASNNYDLQLRKQSEDRMYRAGRTKPSVYYDILTRGSIEHHILKLLKSKNQLSKRFIQESVLQAIERM